MTVIFGQPTTGQPFGPGITFSIRSDLVGPVSGANWLVSWSLTSGTIGPYQTSFVPSDFHTFSILDFMALPGIPLVVPAPRSSFLAASSTFLVGQLKDGTGAVVEQGEVNVVPNWFGYFNLLSQQLARGVVAGLAGADFTTILNAVQKAYHNAP